MAEVAEHVETLLSLWLDPNHPSRVASACELYEHVTGQHEDEVIQAVVDRFTGATRAQLDQFIAGADRLKRETLETLALERRLRLQ